MCALLAATAFRQADFSSPAAANAPADVEAVLAQEAARANKAKGKTTGHSTFVEAVHRGKTIYYQFEVNLPINRINTSVIAETFEKQSKAMACGNPAFRRALDAGARLEFNYRTSRTKNFIMEARVDASTCRDAPRRG